MSIDVKDHRKYLEGKLRDADELEARKPGKLLEQAAVASETGDPRLDKMLRVLQASKEQAEKHAQAVALKGIGCVQDDMLKLQQFEFFYTKGKVDAFTETALIPAQIILESNAHASEGTA